MAQQQKVTVIIPSRNRSAMLENCIRSIQSVPDYSLVHEILLVDNCTEPAESKKYQQLSKKYRIRYCREERPGLSKARNAGLREATGDIIVFSDDDFIVVENWIKNMLSHYSDPEVACCTGRMVSHTQGEVSQLYERSMSFDRGDEGYRVTSADMKISALFSSVSMIGRKRLGRKTPAPYSAGYGFCSFRKSVFSTIGLFDENLGRGTPAVGSEDVDIFYRILKAGFAIDYVPGAVILHEHRHTIEAVLNDAVSAGISVRAFTKKYMMKDPYIFLIYTGNFFLLISSLVKAFLSNDKPLAKMIRFELSGFLTGKK